MKKVIKGSAFKKWFTGESDIRRVLTPTRDSFHIISNLSEIDDNKHYIMSERHYGEVVIEEVELITEWKNTINTDLHLYVEFLDNESAEKAIERTREIISSTFDVYGFSIHEIRVNEDVENEIKAFLTVDTTKSKLFEITKKLCVYLY